MRAARFSLLLAVLACACQGDGAVTGMTFTVTERFTGEGPLGTCSFETGNEPLLQPDAESLAWSVGAQLGVAGSFLKACGGSGGACSPVQDSQYEYFVVGKPNWTFEKRPTSDLNGLSGELPGILTVSGAGAGGIGVHYGDTTYGPITLTAYVPSELKITSFETWDGSKQRPQESVIATTVKAGSTVNVILRAYDKAGGRLCGRGAADSTGTTGLTLAGDKTMGAADVKANSVVVLTFGAAGTATLKLAFGGAALTQDFDVRP